MKMENVYMRRNEIYFIFVICVIFVVRANDEIKMYPFIHPFIHL